MMKFHLLTQLLLTQILRFCSLQEHRDNQTLAVSLNKINPQKMLVVKMMMMMKMQLLISTHTLQRQRKAMRETMKAFSRLEISTKKANLLSCWDSFFFFSFFPFFLWFLLLFFFYYLVASTYG